MSCTRSCSPGGPTAGLPGSRGADLFTKALGKPLNNFKQGSDVIQFAFQKDHREGWIGHGMPKDPGDLFRKLL